MDRQALQLMLRSGRVLCLDVARMSETARLSARDPRRPHLLFDEPLLNEAIFFKEVVLNEFPGEEPTITTRVYFPYIAEDADLGGESILADPDLLVRAIDGSRQRKPNRRLSAEDQRVLDILRELPTFDPFLMLSRREAIEAERPVSPAYFELQESEWKDIRRPVMAKIARLVGKAAGPAAQSDDPNSAEAALRGSNAVLEAIWKGTASPGIQALIAGFKLDPSRSVELLFAWKGINYYEYQYGVAEKKLVDFLTWLSDAHMSMPRDAGMLPMAVLDRVTALRDFAQAGIVRNLGSVRLILKRYNQAFDALVEDGNPALFQQFLDRAPSAFIDMGIALGLLTHCANAWDMRTQGGRKRLIATDTEPLLDFITMITGGTGAPAQNPAARAS